MPRSRLLPLAVLLGILMVALGLRLHDLTAQGLWIDELYSLEFSAGNCYADVRLPRDQVIESPPKLVHLDNAPSAWSIWTSLEDDQHPPLYYFLLRLWRETFGSSDAACRSFSVVASIAAIILLYDVGRLLVAPGAALWACALMALSQPQILHARDARSYMMLAALILGTTSAVLRIERSGMSVGRGVTLLLLLLATVLTHYFGAAACLVLGAYVLIRFRGQLRTRTFAVMAAAAAIFCATWLPFAIEQLHGYAFNDKWLTDPTVTWTTVLRRFAMMPFRLFAEPPKGFVLAACCGVLLLLLPVLRLGRVPGLRLPLALLATWFTLLSLMDLARSTQQMVFPRYLMGVAPMLYLLSAALLWDLGGWRRHLLPASLALLCTLSLQSTYEFVQPEMRLLGRIAARDFKPNDLIVYHVPGTGDWYASIEHLAVDHYAPQCATPILIATRPLDQAALDRARRANIVWAVIERGAPPPETILPGFRTTRIDLLWGVGHIFRLEPDPSPATTPTAPAETHTSSTPTTRGT